MTTPVPPDETDALERQLFFDQFSARYRELRTDPAAWAAIEAERELECGAVLAQPRSANTNPP